MTTAAIKAAKRRRGKHHDDERWQAVVRRDPCADGKFVYAVRTTGVFCRPTCAARLARRENVCFYANCQEAERAGFRPCKRCRPTGVQLARRQAAIVAQACRLIEAADKAPSLAELAKAAGMSRYHFHRVFKAQTGVTPKAYGAAVRIERVRGDLNHGGQITAAIYRNGYRSSSRFYEDVAGRLGMQPRIFRAGGKGMAIRFAIGQCWLGKILVAATQKGVCAILLANDAEELLRDLQDRFPSAELIGGDAAFEGIVAKVIAFVERPAVGFDLPLDIRGTAFQQRVWEALCKIPAGSTVTYAEIAQLVGRPKSVRAVGQAIAANPLAVAVPCHRVIKSDGSLSGYRWGVARKAKLQRREKEKK